MTENPRTREGLNVGDRVMLHPEGVSVFSILDIEDDHARIESIIASPGKYAFSVAVKFLVPAKS
ncbi:hypothetical protein R1CP_36005 (plasmid) [Rhodococcus opacus]|uniref:Uncharacterized protein n=1 Tax=Rhodococcus opacus TaxID=37919 RepID=A0A1B1KGT0_RHOOP|nr:hypothetical protein [Rhodococcus opacus]ANS31807.1 hypothetical protein R1CP_36005 [Rhodococcus opacus]